MKDVRLVDLMDVKALQKIQDEIDFDIHISKDAPPKLLGDAGRIGQVVRVSINLSRRHLRNQKTLSNILEIIDKYDIPHEYIEIELTETTMDQNFDSIKRLVVGLKENGIASSVDDFGTGYSSLNMLREAPWEVLKIDRSYLPDTKKYDEKRHSMLKHVIAIASDMGFECIVEGVETLEQLKMVKRNNCFMAQGYYFDRPLPVEKFEEKLIYEQ